MKFTSKIWSLEDKVHKAQSEVNILMAQWRPAIMIDKLVIASEKLNKALSDLNEEVYRERRRSERIKP